MNSSLFVLPNIYCKQAFPLAENICMYQYAINKNQSEKGETCPSERNKAQEKNWSIQNEIIWSIEAYCNL